MFVQRSPTAADKLSELVDEIIRLRDEASAAENNQNNNSKGKVLSYFSQKKFPGISTIRQ